MHILVFSKNKQTQCRFPEIFSYVATTSSLTQCYMNSNCPIFSKSSLLSPQEIHCTLTGFSLLVPWSRKCPQVESQEDLRTQLVCFCSFRGHNPFLPLINVEKVISFAFPQFSSGLQYMQGRGKSSTGYSAMARSRFTLDYENLGMGIKIFRVISKNVRMNSIYQHL